MSIQLIENDYHRLLKLFDNIIIKTNIKTIPEFAETVTVSRGRYRGQRHNNERSPYMKEVLYELSPQSETQELYIMGASQWGKSYNSGIVSAYYTSEVPSEILYVSGQEEASRKWFEREYEPRVISMGVEFKPEHQNQNKRSGNKVNTKTFPSGVIDIATASSISQISSDTKRVIIMDEIDRYSKQLAGGQGSAFDNIMARSKQWASQRKIYGISTPTTYDDSLIWQLFQTGDQCFYLIPCPLCGHMQILKIYTDSNGFGLYWKVSGEIVIENTVEYICEKCSKGFSEKYKYDCLINGKWNPTATPNPYVRSFQVSTLMSNFESWYNVAIDHQKMQEGHITKQGFYNLTLGIPFRDVGSRPKVEKLLEHRGHYKSGQVLDGVIYLTFGGDVQQGAEKYRQMSNEELDQIILENEDKEYLEPSKLPRIELEVLGHGRGWRSASVCYKRFYGRVNDPSDGAFKKLLEWIEKTGLEFGNKFVRMGFIDAGDQSPEVQGVVQSFCEGLNNIYPIKGFSTLKKREKEKKDELTSNIKRYRQTQDGTGYIIQVNTVFYKSKIYQNLKIQRNLDSESLSDQRPGFCDFPNDYNEHYYKMLTAAEKTTDGGFNSAKRSDEALDCRVYNVCAGDFFLDNFVLSLRGKYKDKYTPDQLRSIDHKFALDILENNPNI